MTSNESYQGLATANQKSKIKNLKTLPDHFAQDQQYQKQ